MHLRWYAWQSFVISKFSLNVCYHNCSIIQYHSPHNAQTIAHLTTNVINLIVLFKFASMVIPRYFKVLTLSTAVPFMIIREDAYSRTGGIFIRDTARDTAHSLWFNELWPNQGQAIPRIIPRIPRCSKIWRMILGRMHELKCKMQKISCKSLQKSDWSYGNERQTSHTNHTQFIWLKLWIKEENGVHKVTIIPTPHHTGRVAIHFVGEVVAYEIEDAYCRTGEDTAYDTWLWVWVNDSYRVMPYKSHTCTGLCRSYKVESNKWFFISFLFVTNPTCSQKKE